MAHIDLVQPAWRRSSRCDAGQCVEVAFLDSRVALRDSKDPDGPRLNVDANIWTAFVGSVRAGEFDRAR
jgi:hypothetical protein